MTLRKWYFLVLLFGVMVGCSNDWSSGDRVLVSKCSYDNGFTKPGRYEVVVFKFPEAPVDKGTPKNYIKRLLGLPGELLAIFFGRVYRWKPPQDAPPPFDDLKDGKVNANDLMKPEFMHLDNRTSKEWFENGDFEILRKPPHTMLALRRIVYDNDYQPKDLAKDFPGKYDRWSPGPKSGWKADGPTGFAIEGKSDGQVDWLRYQHLLRGGGAKPLPQLITDSMSYNSFKVQSNHPGDDDSTPRSPHWVGDLMIESNVQVVEPKGEFYFELNKGIYRYQARWDLATGQCKLTSIDKDGKEKDLGTKDTSVKSPGNYMLRFANIDARLTVWVDRALPFGDGQDYDPPEVMSQADRAKNLGDQAIKDAIKDRRGPDENDLKPASIGSKGANVKISHVRVWRDTYYTTSVNRADYVGEISREGWSSPDAWKPIREQAFATMYVQPGHYLCLGDNSQASSDSRHWGVVPERLMLGRALVVYFPLDRIGLIR